METVEDKRTFVRVDTGTAVVDFEGHCISVSGDDHFDLPPVAGELARVVNQDAEEAVNGFARCAHEGILVAELHEDESEL